MRGISSMGRSGGDVLEAEGAIRRCGGVDDGLQLCGEEVDLGGRGGDKRWLHEGQGEDEVGLEILSGQPDRGSHSLEDRDHELLGGRPCRGGCVRAALGGRSLMDRGGSTRRTSVV